MQSSTEIMHHLETVAAFIPFPLYWMDLDARVLGANQACVDVFGAHGIDDVIGKTLFEFYPKDTGAVDHVNRVIRTGQRQLSEDIFIDASSGKQRVYAAIRSPLIEKNGQTFGVIGAAFDLAGHPEAAHQLENNRQLVGLAEKEAFTHMAHKVAHDIQSPLTALSVMLNVCDELHEAKRLILKNAFTAIKDIANNILNKYSRDDSLIVENEERKMILCSDFILKSISERKYQYQHLPISFDVTIPPSAQFSFIEVQSSQFARAICNLISNAVDAVDGQANAKISVKLEVDEVHVQIAVQDNGRGLTQKSMDRILNRTRFTEGKDNGHGLGMMQVWDMLDNNDGHLKLYSSLGHGTLFELTFARAAKAEWIMDEITVNSNDIVVILDDDQLIHDAWNLRLTTLQNSMSDLIIRHEKQGQAVIDYISSLSPDDRVRVYLLCDFELINQSMHGMQVIDACKLERVVLVTSYYANPAIQKSASQQGIKILPKQMASIVPINCVHNQCVVQFSTTDTMYDKNYYSIEQQRDKYSWLSAAG